MLHLIWLKLAIYQKKTATYSIECNTNVTIKG